MKLFTSESVTEGHPDKICDQVSTPFWTPSWRRTRRPTWACETTATTGVIHVMGEITTSLLRGHSPALCGRWSTTSATTTPKCGFDGNTCGVLTSINPQSPDIAMGVNQSWRPRTGD